MKSFLLVLVVVADFVLVAMGFQPWWWVSSLIGLVLLGLGVYRMLPLTDGKGDLKRELRSDVAASRRLVRLLAMAGLGLGLSLPGYLSDVVAFLSVVVALSNLEKLAARERARE